MDICITRDIAADAATVFRLAAAVEDWPRILPHYRWVRVVRDAGQSRRIVEMAARRDVVPGLAIPLRWTAIETTRPTVGRIEFEHVRGITRGMQVAWTIEPHAPTGVRVRIRHVFAPRWPIPDALVHAVVGEYFVNGVAARTLDHIARLAESRP